MREVSPVISIFQGPSLIPIGVIGSTAHAGLGTTSLIQAYLQDLKLLQPLLYQLLDLPRVLDAAVLPEGISRPALRILSEVVGGELVALP